MGNKLHRLRNLGLYLLPGFLLATTGVLLAALLYYPAPSTLVADESRAVTIYEQDFSDGFSADALWWRFQAEQKPQARTLMYQYERDAVYTGEQPAIMLPALPLFDDRGDSGRPALIRL